MSRRVRAADTWAMPRITLSRAVVLPVVSLLALLSSVAICAGLVGIASAAPRHRIRPHVTCRRTARQHKPARARARKVVCRPAPRRSKNRSSAASKSQPSAGSKTGSRTNGASRSGSGSASGSGSGSASGSVAGNTATSPTGSAPGGTVTSTHLLFSPTSIWNRALPMNAPLDPSSASITAYLNSFVSSSQTQGIGPWINTTNYSTPIYTVPANQPTVPVTVDYNPVALSQAFATVPIPSDAKPAAGSDAQMTIYQPATDTMWEMWEMRQDTSGRWHAGWGGRMVHVSSNPGYYQNVPGPSGGMLEQSSWGATASSLPIAAGLITLADLASGHINHAVAMMVPKAKAKVFYCPAQRTDGYDTSANAIPEGAHFRIDPNLDLSKLSMPPITRMIAQAAQTYGLIVNDQTGATVGFRAEDPTPLMRTGAPNPYGTYFANPATGQYVYPTQFLASFPWSHLQLLAPPATCS